MPRGNDAAAAKADLIAKGGVTTNVEAMIQASQARLTPGLLAAQVRAIDAEATAELDLKKVAKDAKLPDGHTVESAAVRGNAVSYVATGPDHRSYKGVYYPNADDEPADEPLAAVARERAASEGDVAMAVAQAKAEADLLVAKAVEDIEAEASKQIQEARDKANKAIAKAEEEAAKADASDDAGDAGDPTGSNDPAQGSGPKRKSSSASKKKS